MGIVTRIIKLEPDRVVLSLPRGAARDIEELMEKDLVMELSAAKDKRTLRQNALLWALIDEIDTKLNGYRTEEGMMNIYKDIIKDARIRTEYLQMTHEACEELKKKHLFRVIEIVEERKNSALYRCYWGSSHFDKKDMADFVEALLRYAVNAGIDIKKYEEMRGN